MGNWRTTYPVENGWFPDDSVDWMETPEGQQSIEVLHVVFDALNHVDVDASGACRPPASGGLYRFRMGCRCMIRVAAVAQQG